MGIQCNQQGEWEGRGRGFERFTYGLVIGRVMYGEIYGIANRVGERGAARERRGRGVVYVYNSGFVFSISAFNVYTINLQSRRYAASIYAAVN